MPSYTTKRRRSRQRNVARIKKSVSRDRRQLLHWSAKGTHQDYEKLRAHAKKVVHRTPSYIDQDVVTDIAENASRRMLAENVHGSSFLDGLAWTLDQVPGGNWTWIKQAVQGAMKPFRGDSLTEQDELYALLLDQAYKDEPKDHLGQWVRDPELGSEFVQVYDNADGHRYIAVRGTKLHGTWAELGADLKQDAGLAVGLDPTNIVGEELQRILDHTRPGTVVDIGGHSLGTSLIGKAFEDNPDLQDRIHQSFFYNPVFSPVALTGNALEKYEADDRVRWFIDLLDTVSLGNLGSAGPSNAVYRSTFGWNPIGPHDLSTWGDGISQDALADVPSSKPKDVGLSEPSPPVAADGMGQAFGEGSFLDFGAESWNPADFGL